MAFIYSRTIRFSDTDAAGVVYFANVLAICHEAYEESLIASGIEVRSFFKSDEMAVPIVHASVDFFKPMICGDRILVYSTPNQIKDSEFEIEYQLRSTTEQVIAKALTRHVCINPKTRARMTLSLELSQWLNDTNV